MKTPPRILICGAGLIGSYLGGRLHGPAQVCFMARPQTAAQLREHGLSVSDLYGHRQRIAPQALDLRGPDDPLHDVDAALLTVKSAATEAAGRELAERLAPGTPVISFQNGVRNAAALRAVLPDFPVLAGMVPFNVMQPAPMHFHQASSGELMVERAAVVEPLLPVFAAAGLPLRLREDMPSVLWAKLLLNLNNPLNALSGLPLREELAQRSWRRCLALLQREGLDALQAAGIRPARVTALPARWLPGALSLPDGVFRRVAARMLAIDPLARSSTWDDLQKGRRTEVDYINGEIVALAASHGLRAPANARMVELIRRAEASYTSWNGEALLQDLRNLP